MPILCITVAVTNIGIGIAKTVSLIRAQRNDEVPLMDWTVPNASAYGTQPNVNMNAKVPIAKPQSEIPQIDVAINRVLENMFRIKAVFDGKTVSCCGVVLGDRKLLLLRHFLEELSVLPAHTNYYGNFHLRKNFITAHTHGIEFNLFDCEMTYYNKVMEDGTFGSNYVVCYLPIKFPQCKDLTKFIASQSLHATNTGEGLMVQNNGRIIDNMNLVKESSRPLVIQAIGSSSAVTMKDLYSYKLQGRGLCGSIILSKNLERPIVGMHVAGVERGNVRGIAEMLVAESFTTIPDKTKAYTNFVLPEMTDAEFSKINIESLVFPYGCTDSTMTAHQSGDTQYIPSLIQGVFPVRTEPNPLSKKDPRLPEGCSPLAMGCAHMGKPPKDFEEDLLREATIDLRRVLIQNVKPVRGTVGVVSLQDAICGNSSIDGFEPLEWSTSPGYPLRFCKDKTTGLTGKKWLFELDETQDGYRLKGLHPKLSLILRTDQKMRENGIKPFTVFIDCLKDTCLPSEKCKIPGKTRIFSISPVQFTIQFKQYFLDFMASYQKARLSAEHAIGIDVNSLEWTGLANHLTSKGDKIICGDYKNYGPGLMLKAAEYAFSIILDWYSHHGANEQDQKVRRIMVYEILGAYHLATNLIYTTPCGIPSGSPITTPLNSIVGSLYIRCIWKKTTNLSFVDLTNKCNIVTYGDDVCINVSDDVCEAFNTVTMSAAFGRYNITFTDADKTGNLIKWRSLSNATFLKNEFKPHPFRSGVYLAALDKVSIEGCANWINKRNNKQEATVQNAEQCVMLAHGWGKEYYNEVIAKLEKALTENDLTFRYDSWLELDRKRYSQLDEVPLPQSDIEASMELLSLESQNCVPNQSDYHSIANDGMGEADIIVPVSMEYCVLSKDGA